MAKYEFPIGSLVRIAAAILTLISVPFAHAQSAKDDSLKIYDHVFIHPKEPVSSYSSKDQEGIVEVTHQDGTVEKIFANVWNADLNRATAAWVAFGDRPSTQTFAALDDIQKRSAVRAVLYSSNDQEDEEFGDARRKLAHSYMTSLSRGDQDRILLQAFNTSLDMLAGDTAETENTIKIFRELTRGQSLKMRDVICPHLYSPQREFEEDFSEPFVLLLDKIPETKSAMALTCPTKNKGSFKIGDQVAKVREGIYVDPDDAPKINVQAVPQLQVLSAVKCSREDFLRELKDVELDFLRSPGAHSNWFRRSVGECRFQGSVKKIANGKFEFQLQAALPGEAKVSPLPFKDFDELKAKLNLVDEKTKLTSAEKTAIKSVPASSISENRSARVAR